MQEEVVGSSYFNPRLDELQLFIITSFIFLGIVDSVLTYVGVSVGLSEGNILVSWIIGHGWTAFFTFKLLIGLFIAGICYRLKTKLLPGILTFFGLLVAFWNINLII